MTPEQFADSVELPRRIDWRHPPEFWTRGQVEEYAKQHAVNVLQEYLAQPSPEVDELRKLIDAYGFACLDGRSKKMLEARAALESALRLAQRGEPE